MPKIPRDKRYRKYSISSYRYRELYYFTLQYNEWQKELIDKRNTAKALTITDMPVAHNYESDQVSEAAIECVQLENKIEMVEECVRLAAPDLYKYVLDAVTNRDVNYNYLCTRRHIPCSRNTFEDRRHKYYWILSSRMKYLNEPKSEDI